jgi:putative membrane protein
MRYFNWLWRLIIFVKNDQPVTLRYFFNTEWHTSLVIVLLLFFAAGVAIGVLAMLLNLLQQRREISNLKRDIRVKNQLAGIEASKSLV